MRKRSYLVAALIALLALVSVGTAENTKNFVAPLSGGEEVPPRDTQARGVAVFHVVNDGTEIFYKLNVANLDNVGAAHIHLGAEGVNGPVVAFLFAGPEIQGTFNGTLAEGTITAADLLGSLAGMPLSALIDAMEEGTTYVNTHTEQFPGGEIRGQIE